MSADKWKKITRDHVLCAIKIFFAENPEYPAPRSTFLVYVEKSCRRNIFVAWHNQVATGVTISKEAERTQRIYEAEADIVNTLFEQGQA